MPSKSDLPFMLQLADDPSENVQFSLGEAFSTFGGELDTLLLAQSPPASHELRQRARTLVQDYRRDWLRDNWESWFTVPGHHERLEAVMRLITGFQDGPHAAARTTECLDQLAHEFFNTFGEHNPITLARYLFDTRGIKGAEPDYYLPQNSNLRYVIESRRGIPISLSLLYVLVAHRLGYEATACNWPGHFLATAVHQGKRYVVDCFRGGQCVEADKFLSLQGPSREAARALLEEDAPVEAIAGRSLTNLVRQSKFVEHFPNALLMVELLKDLERRQSTGAQR